MTRNVAWISQNCKTIAMFIECYLYYTPYNSLCLCIVCPKKEIMLFQQSKCTKYYVTSYFLNDKYKLK